MKTKVGQKGSIKNGVLGGLTVALLMAPLFSFSAEVDFTETSLGSWTSSDRARQEAVSAANNVQRLNTSRGGDGHQVPAFAGARAASELQETIKTARLSSPREDLDARPAFPIEDGVGAVGTILSFRSLGPSIVGTVLTHEGNTVTFNAERHTTPGAAGEDILHHSTKLMLSDGRKITWNSAEADLSGASGRTLSPAAQALLDPFAARDTLLTITYPNGMYLSQTVRHAGGAVDGVTMRTSLLSKEGKVVLTSVRTEKGLLGPVETVTRFDGKTTRSVTKGMETFTEVRTDTGKLLEKSVATTARKSVGGGKTALVTTTQTTRYSLAGLVIATVTTETVGNESRSEVKSSGGAVSRTLVRVMNNMLASVTQTDPQTGREFVLGRHGIYIYLGNQQPAFFVPRG